MKDRLIELRKKLHLSQRAFGEPLKLSRSGIANYEQGICDIPDRTISDICRVYSVNPEWLRTGKGDTFISNKSLDNLIKQYDLDECEAEIITTFLELEPDKRKAVTEYILLLAEKVSAYKSL